MILRILAVGDVVGAPGLTFLTERLRAFQEQEHIDFTVGNGENAHVELRAAVPGPRLGRIFRARRADLRHQPHGALHARREHG